MARGGGPVQARAHRVRCSASEQTGLVGALSLNCLGTRLIPTQHTSLFTTA
jgi:hypothetical protein